tara:strand:+ start:8933 stop:9736 length:804 start_codon:yes stop_codon:yes gene_type:complete
MSIILNKKPIILIDSSYYTFYRYYATLKWYGFQNKDIDTDNIMNNEEFLSSFNKHFQNDISKLSKKWKTSTNNIFFCLDCSRVNIWRNDIHDSYKSHRIQNANFNRSIFDFFKLHNNFSQIQVDHLEADDIVSIIFLQIRSISQTHPVIIITNDSDYLQLSDSNTTIYNMQMKDISSRLQFDCIKKELFYKALMGDKSDNIIKCGNIKKSEAIKITNLEEEERKKWIEKFKYKDEYYKNQKLIDFRFIPDDLRNKCLEQITIKMITS